MNIRTRLTFRYAVLLTATLIVFAVIMIVLLSFNLQREVDNSLETRAEQVEKSIEAVLESRQDPFTFLTQGQVVLPPIDVFAAANLYVELRDINGETVARSSNLSNQHLPMNESNLRAVQSGRKVWEVYLVGNTRVRLLHAPLKVRDQVIGIIQVGKSLATQDETMRTLTMMLSISIGIAVVLAWFGGETLSRRALIPIERITETAQEITKSGDLTRRMNWTGPADEIGQLAATFDVMLKRIEQLFHTQEQLVADVSHELRTPLTTIRGNVNLLQSGKVSTTDEQTEVLSTIENEAARMARLVSDILLLAQADAGLILRKEMVELDTLLLEVYSNSRLRANEVDLKLGEMDQVQVWGDSDRLRQLFINLLDNALRYTPAGGKVTLSWGRSEDDLDVWIEIADTGPGIPAQEIPRLFERFYRSDKARSRAKGGSGLGLAIAKWIAEEHEGEIEVESTVGKGSTFLVWLPLYHKS